MTNQNIKKPKPAKCKICGRKYVSKQALIDHIGREHKANIPEGWSPARYECYLRTGKTSGHCIYCKKEVGFNEKTGKYNRMCGSAVCKKKAADIAKKNYIGLHGKPYTIDDPEVQRKMVYSKKTSGKYIFEDEKTGKKYVALYDSSFGEDFFRMLDLFLGWDGSDVSGPSPHTYYYEYEGKKHFYVPDAYLHSINLEVELKDGGDNPNTHPKIQAVDKVKEQKKDEVMMSLRNEVNYIKICNKDYSEFFALLSYLRDKDVCELPKWESKLESSVYESVESMQDSVVTEGEDPFSKKIRQVKTQYELENPNLTYDKILLSYRNRIFHKRNTKEELNEIKNELTSMELYLKKSLNARGEEVSRMKFETEKTIKEIQHMIDYIDEVGYRDCIESTLPEGFRLADSGDLKEYEQYADLDAAKGEVQEGLYTDNAIISGDDMIYNLDSWKPKKNHNVLLITGLSGSGKSTLSKEYALKYEAEVFQLDWVQHYQYIGSDERVFNYGLAEYIKRTCLSARKAYREEDDKTGEKWRELVIFVFSKILDFANSHSSELFIVEGIQIIGYLHDYPNIDKFPIIIKGTSIMTSMTRRIRRDGIGNGLKAGNESLISYYINSNKFLNMFRRQVAAYESVTIENSAPVQEEIHQGHHYPGVTFSNDVILVNSVLEKISMFDVFISEYHEALLLNETPVAAISLEKVRGFDRYGNLVVGVLPEYRRKGYGSILVNRLYNTLGVLKYINSYDNKELANMKTLLYGWHSNDRNELTILGMFAHHIGFQDIYKSGEGKLIYKAELDELPKINTNEYALIETELPNTMITYSDSKEDIKKIVRSLDEKDRDYIGHKKNGEARWCEERVFYRKVLYENGEPAAFVKVYVPYNHTDVANITVATGKKFRGKGYSKFLISDFIQNHVPEYIHSLQYGYDNGNKSSEKLAKSLGFDDMLKTYDGSGWYCIKPVDKLRKLNVQEATFIQAFKGEQRCYPIFVLLTFTGTKIATLIKKYTKDPYAHASISFDTTLDHMTSFNAKGMVDEDIHTGEFRKRYDVATYSLYMYVATEDEYRAMRQFVDELYGKQGQMKYNLLGLTNFIFGRGSEREDRYFCSEFVSAAIAAGNSHIFNKPPYMISPYYFAKNKHFIFITSGKLKNYDQKKVDRIVSQKLTEGGYDRAEFDY